MMSLIVDLNIRKGRDYGQECKELNMCLPRSSSPPPPTKEEKEAEMEIFQIDSCLKILVHN